MQGGEKITFLNKGPIFNCLEKSQQTLQITLELRNVCGFSCVTNFVSGFDTVCWVRTQDFSPLLVKYIELKTVILGTHFTPWLSFLSPFSFPLISLPKGFHICAIPYDFLNYIKTPFGTRERIKRSRLCEIPMNCGINGENPDVRKQPFF